MRQLCAMLAFALLTLTAAAQRFDYDKHYAQRTKLFQTAGDVGPSTIVMLGNSLTENADLHGGWPQLLGTQHVVNRGIVGDDAAGMARRLGQIVSRRPKAIFLMCGANDMSHGLSARKVFELVSQLAERIQAEAPATRLYVQSMLPIDEGTKRWKTLENRSADIPKVNAMLRDFCREKGITFVDLYAKFTLGDSVVMASDFTVDGLHLSDLGYQVWAAQLKPYIAQLTDGQ